MDSKFIFDQSNIMPTKFEENSGFSAFQSRFANGNFDSILNKLNSNGKFDESSSFPKNTFLQVPKPSVNDEKSSNKPKLIVTNPIEEPIVKPNMNISLQKESTEDSAFKKLKKKRVNYYQRLLLVNSIDWK